MQIAAAKMAWYWRNCKEDSEGHMKAKNNTFTISSGICHHRITHQTVNAQRIQPAQLSVYHWIAPKLECRNKKLDLKTFL